MQNWLLLFKRFIFCSQTCSIIIALICASCTGYQHMTTAAYVPQHRMSGEFRANLYPGGAQLGYSVTNHLLVYAAGYYRQAPGGPRSMFEKKDVDRYRESNATDFELGAGFYSGWNKFIYEFIGGASFGKMEYINKRPDHYDYEFNLKARTMNLYVQPDIGFNINQHFTMAIFAKLNFSLYTDMADKTVLGGYAEPEFADQNFINKQHLSFFTLSPGVSFEGGWEQMKFHAQASPNIKLGNDNVRHQPVNLNVGLSFFLSPNK
jgi:hypothetical protein